MRIAKPGRRIIPLFIPNYGCEHDCVFCDQRLISGEDVPVSADDVRRACALQYSGNSDVHPRAAEQGQPVELAFYGGSFTAIPESTQNELLQAAQEVFRYNARNSIRISTRPDNIDESTVRRLKSYGVSVIEIGAQSMCDEVLALAGRGHTAADVERAAGIIKRAELTLILQMMTGLPGDSAEKARQTAERIAAMKPDGVRIYPAVIVRGTKLYEMWRRGQYREHSIDDAVGLCAELCALFEASNIPVIRLGLNPTDNLSAGDAAAGAYHPAFGELVYSRMYFDRAVAMIDRLGGWKSLRIEVARGHLSKMLGQRRGNYRKLTEKYLPRDIKIVEADIEPGEIMIEITS